MWRIRRRTDSPKKYWSADVGWTWLDFADIFSTEQKESMVLPRGGAWEAVPE